MSSPLIAQRARSASSWAALPPFRAAASTACAAASVPPAATVREPLTIPTSPSRGSWFPSTATPTRRFLLLGQRLTIFFFSGVQLVASNMTALDDEEITTSQEEVEASSSEDEIHKLY